MTTTCPSCHQPVEVHFTHQGVSSDGVFQRGLLEATHSKDKDGNVCAGWKSQEHDLVTLYLGAAE